MRLIFKLINFVYFGTFTKLIISTIQSKLVNNTYTYIWNSADPVDLI